MESCQDNFIAIDYLNVFDLILLERNLIETGNQIKTAFVIELQINMASPDKGSSKKERF
jgi:hypothetical protein